MKLILSSSNIMQAGRQSVIRQPLTQKSNVELINSLRSNFLASQQIETSPANGTDTNGQAVSHPPSWTLQSEDALYIPAIDFSQHGLSEERDQYDITVKLFYLPGIPVSRRCAHTREAIDMVLKELHVKSIDLLIVSFPGILFDADDDSEEEDNEMNSGEPDDFDSMVQTWQVLESLHEQGVIDQLGVAEFGSERLARFLPHTKVKPSVDQINLKDCCVVPKHLILYAKQEQIQLLTHNDCHDILPVGTTRELLGPAEKGGAGILASSSEANDGIQGDVEPQWVVKYTAVVKDRGVVENKGYFASADVGACVKDRS
ncbi:uncharacterized protein N7479_008623 [Penicillium vulpinum]|uniref:GCS light chain n=1 Tax=Penicillium vulpinum TaxID=29845 RepID=A0A1V6S1J3_9EURO|nr:uncharacterized protein N7479_008623 [Penicillium vulpinum]KAJ5950210.1 hypothetical protein N7479_008623 [Penicillium vulpinum]OQE07726.1 hypothetical protein PENVUL_c012G08109 [Penicillium vulpinum]